MAIIEYQCGEYTISTDHTRLDVIRIHWMLTEFSYWAKDRPLAIVQRSVENSLNFGIYTPGELIGYARVVTDYSTFAWLCDVIIHPDHRGNNLGKWLVETVVDHPDIKSLKRFLLATRDAHELYRKYGGFNPLANPERWMEKLNPEPRIF